MPTTEAPAVEAGTERPKVVGSILFDHLVMVGLLIAWVGPWLHGIGGRDAGGSHTMAIVALIATVLMRPWRLSWPPLVLAIAVSAAALIDCAVDATGWAGVDWAAGYVIVAAVGLCALTFVRTTKNTEFLIGLICVGGFYEFATTARNWIETGVPTVPLNGSFYWYNPFAAFVLPSALLGLGMVVASTRGWKVLGWIAAPCGVAGVILSTSRATMAVLAVGWILLLFLSVRSRAQAIRAGLVSLLAIGLSFLLPGPPFFSHWHSPFGGTAARDATGQSLQTSGLYRTQYWRESIAVFKHHPLTGGGFHSLAGESFLYSPTGWAHGEVAHNGILQPLSDGGLLLAVPFVIALAIGLWWALRVLPTGMSGRRVPAAEPLQLAAALALLGGFAHSMVDFDWTHPVILAEWVMLAAIVGRDRGVETPSRGARPVRFLLVGATVAAGLITVLALGQFLTDTVFSGQPVASYLADSQATFGDYRPAQLVLILQVEKPGFATVPQVRQALALTASPATEDVELALERDAAAATIGDPAAVSDAERLVNSLRPPTTDFDGELATVKSAAAHAQAPTG